MMFHHLHDFTLIPALLPLLILSAIAFLYLIAAIRQQYKGRCWSTWRSASFVLGIALLCIAVSRPLAMLAHQDLRMHMVQHILIGMLAPLALALAAPLTLALRSFPAAISRWIVRLLHSEFVDWLSYPITALLLNIGGMYLLYLSPLYKFSLSNPLVHYLMHTHFFIAGYLFTWAIAGPDPAPRRPGLTTRITVLFVAIAAHATLGKLMYIYLFPFNTFHNADEIRSAAKIMYYGGDIAEILLAIALLAGWYYRRKLRPYNP